jgi:hypothetical protein
MSMVCTLSKNDPESEGDLRLEKSDEIKVSVPL